MKDKLQLVAIRKTIENNEEFVQNPLCQETIFVTIDFYKKVGYTPPWICYYVKNKNGLVATCGFKGKPQNGSIEIAYGTFEKYRNRGIGAEVCKLLVDVALKTDPDVRITARTLAEENYSTRILRKNKFTLLGIVDDPEDGEVWEWLYNPAGS